jgi:HlyD family secretion protein
MNPEQIRKLQIDPQAKRRPRATTWIIILAVVIVAAVAAIFAVSQQNERRVFNRGTNVTAKTEKSISNLATNSASTETNDSVLTVSGYIVNRERIEISPRFLGVVKWIGVKKGDAVTNQQVIALLDDVEYKARLAETEGRVATAKTGLEKARVAYERVVKLSKTDIESKQAEDDARLAVESAQSMLQEAEGAREVTRTYVAWCTIRSPINGVVLEKLVDPNELVTPQSFGGTKGPSTAILAIADPKDLQVEIDLNEADLSKVSLNQKCRVSPEAYPEKHYEGQVAEIAPEADRSKGTLQVKVQIRDPDKFLTPELSAKVDFLKQ